MKVAFLFDPGNADGTVGGAELTMREFRAAAPADVEVGVDAGGLQGADVVVIGNCVSYAADTIQGLQGKRVIRFHNDLARHERPELREWLERNATHVFTSPLHQDLYGLDGVWPNIPPAIDLDRFRPSRQVRRNGHRQGAVAITSWQGPGKGQQMLAEWADANEPLDVYGNGAYRPMGEGITDRGAIEYDQVPQALWGYRTFVHLPTAPEPFGRGVVEAWAAGCELVVNGLVGAAHYLREEPEKLRTAAEDFWRLVVREPILDSGRGK